jgi:hypothetical protein
MHTLHNVEIKMCHWSQNTLLLIATILMRRILTNNDPSAKGLVYSFLLGHLETNFCVINSLN